MYPNNLSQPTKTNVAKRFVVDTLRDDGWNPRVDCVQEFDVYKRDISNLTSKVGFGVKTEATVGIRRNLSSLENRASLNVKFELPKIVQKVTFGWSPAISLEFRGN